VGPTTRLALAAQLLLVVAVVVVVLVLVPVVVKVGIRDHTADDCRHGNIILRHFH
jgi:hypothetical protein